MSDVIDGAFGTPERRRKLFVSQRHDESGDAFTTRMMQFILAMEAGQTLDVVLASGPGDWEILSTQRWLEARNRTYPQLRLRSPASHPMMVGLSVTWWSSRDTIRLQMTGPTFRTKGSGFPVQRMAVSGVGSRLSGRWLTRSTGLGTSTTSVSHRAGSPSNEVGLRPR